MLFVCTAAVKPDWNADLVAYEGLGGGVVTQNTLGYHSLADSNRQTHTS